MLSGEKILVTGAAGQLTFPITRELIKNGNEVWGMARFSNPDDRKRLEAIGARCIQKDVGLDSLDDLPGDFTYVFHAGAVTGAAAERDWDYTFKVNAHGTARLLYHLRDSCKSFLHCSTASIYKWQGRKEVKETDPLGLHIPCYSFSKVAAEELVNFISNQFNVPAVMIRIASFYGPTGGAPARRLDMIVEGKEILLNPDKPNWFRPIYQDDGVELGIKAMTLGQVPPLIVNWCGNDVVSAEEYCEYLGALIGKRPRFRYTEDAYTGLVPDVTKMHQVLGKCKVHWKEGMKLTIQGRYPELPIKEGV